MTIPKQFKLFGQTIEVVYDKEMGQRDGIIGSANHTHNKIILQPNSAGYARTQEQVDQCFYHELVHCVLKAMGEGDDHDEKFVDVFASLLHQYETSKED